MNARGSMAAMVRVTGIRVFIGRNLFCTYPALAGEVEFAPAFEFTRDHVAAVEECLTQIVEAADLTSSAAPLLRHGDLGPREVAAQRIGWLSLALQNLAGANVRDFGAAADPDGKIWALSAYQNPQLGQFAMQIAWRIVAYIAANKVAYPLPPPFHDAIADLSRMGSHAHVHRENFPVLAFATARGIPHYPTPDIKLVQLGQGARQRVIRGTTSDTTSHVGVLFARNKLHSAELLARIGLPTTAPRRVDSLEAAVEVAGRLGFPVVVKPNLGEDGKGVTADVADADELPGAFARAAAAQFGPVLIEKFVPGFDHRLLVVSGRLVAAAKRIPAHVIGDGRSSVDELIATANRDPRRGRVKHSRLMEALVHDEEAARIMARSGLTLASRPPAGETVWLRATANISTGGAAVDVSDAVHPEVREIAEVAARALRIDVLAVDYLTTDISRPPGEVGGAICEVNSAPGIRPHELAGTDRERYMGPILDRLFQNGDTGRIPIVAIVGAAGSNAVARVLAAILVAAGLTTGLACANAVTVGTRTLRRGNCAGGEAARMLIFDPCTEAAVIELTGDGLYREGVPVETCDVAAVIGDPGGVHDEPQWPAGTLARLHALVAAAASRQVILDAEDPQADHLAAAAAAPVCLVSRRASHPRVEAHLRLGGVACVLADDGAEIVRLHGGDAGESLCRLREISEIGAVDARIALYATAIARGLDIPVRHIRAGVADTSRR